MVPNVCIQISRRWKKISTNGSHHCKLHPFQSLGLEKSCVENKENLTNMESQGTLHITSQFYKRRKNLASSFLKVTTLYVALSNCQRYMKCAEKLAFFINITPILTVISNCCNHLILLIVFFLNLSSIRGTSRVFLVALFNFPILMSKIVWTCFPCCWLFGV